MKRSLLLALALLAGPVYAQTPITTLPLAVSSSNSSSTITATNVFQQVFNAGAGTATNRGRSSCTIQNNGTNSMWVFPGLVAAATKGASIVLSAGQTYYCSVNNVTLQDAIAVTGTIGDAFYAAQQ